MTTRIAIVLSLLCASLAGPASAADAPALCATPEQAKQVQELYRESPPPPPFMAAPRLGMPEAVVASALPAERAVGTGAEAFFPVWESLQAWDDTVTLVMKGGQIFEIRGRVHAGKPSKISKNFNLDEEGAGLGGHLRPDLMAAIYAIELPGREGPIRGIAFYDQQGNGTFMVLIPPAKAPANATEKFEATRAIIRQAPRACPAPR